MMKRGLAVLAWAGAFYLLAAVAVTVGIVAYFSWRYGASFTVDIWGLQGLQGVMTASGEEHQLESAVTRIGAFSVAVPLLSAGAGLFLGALGLLPGTRPKQKGATGTV